MKLPKYISHEQMVKAIGPVTRGELDHLRANRDKPTLVPEYTMGGVTEKIIHQFEQERRDVREAYIANRLDRIEGRAANDFGLAKEKGRAKADFDRER